MIHIRKGTRIVARTGSLDGILRYARAHKTSVLSAVGRKAKSSAEFPRLVIHWRDGASVTLAFLKFEDLGRFLARRRSWEGRRSIRCSLAF